MSPWALVVADHDSPTAERMLAIASELAGRGLRVGGFVQRCVTESGERRYLAERLGAIGRVHLSRRGSTPRPGEEVCCNCLVATAGFDEVRGWLDEDRERSDVIILDGLGRFEVAGLGHTAALRRLLAATAPMVLSIRPEQLGAIMDRFGLGEPFAAVEGGEPLRPLVGQVARVAVAAQPTVLRKATRSAT